MRRRLWRAVRPLWSVTVEPPLLWWAEWRYQTRLARWEREEHARGLYPHLRLARLRAQREFAAMVDDLLRQAGLDTDTGTEGECWAARHTVLVPHFPAPTDTRPALPALRHSIWPALWEWSEQSSEQSSERGETPRQGAS
jgi:hypothetical protein